MFNKNVATTSSHELTGSGSSNTSTTEVASCESSGGSPGVSIWAILNIIHEAMFNVATPMLQHILGVAVIDRVWHFNVPNG
jgi:hypothetical protein